MSDTDEFVTVRWPDGALRLRLTVGEAKERVALREGKQTVERRHHPLRGYPALEGVK